MLNRLVLSTLLAVSITAYAEEPTPTEVPATQANPEYITKAESLAQFKEASLPWDLNHDGVLSLEELQGPPLATFKEVDTNHDGQATLDEFVEYTLEQTKKYNQGRRMALNAEQTEKLTTLLTNIVKSLDTDHDSKVSLQEYLGKQKQFFDLMDTNHDNNVTLEELVDYLFAFADTNKDGKLTKDEYSYAIMNMVSKLSPAQ